MLNETIMRIIHIIIPTLILLFTSLQNPSLALKPEREYKARPSDYGIVYREVTLTTSDSLHINAWFYPAQDTAGIANDLVGRYLPVPAELRHSPRPYIIEENIRHPTIIVSLADAGNMQYLLFYAYHLCTLGFNVLTFDWRGFGGS
jgi:uncharacterized protein